MSDRRWLKWSLVAVVLAGSVAYWLSVSKPWLDPCEKLRDRCEEILNTGDSRDAMVCIGASPMGMDQDDPRGEAVCEDALRSLE